MLQQTQAARVEPVFEGFMQRFPDVGSLADAPRAEVLRAWGRLGYPRRAVALHRAAAEIVRVHDGEVPRDPSVLRTLPGIGDYTAAAVASLGFGEPVAAIDTNVRRVWARVDLASEADEVSASRPRRSRRGVAGPSPPVGVEPGGDGSRPGGVPADSPL